MGIRNLTASILWVTSFLLAFTPLTHQTQRYGMPNPGNRHMPNPGNGGMSSSGNGGMSSPGNGGMSSSGNGGMPSPGNGGMSTSGNGGMPSQGDEVHQGVSFELDCFGVVTDRNVLQAYPLTDDWWKPMIVRVVHAGVNADSNYDVQITASKNEATAQKKRVKTVNIINP